MELTNKNSSKLISDLFFLVPLSCMFFLSYLTFWRLTSDTEVFGYYAYLEFFSFWRSLKPLFLALVLVKISFFSDYSRKQLLIIWGFLLAVFFMCRTFHPNYFLLYAVAFFFGARNVSYRLIAKTYFIMTAGTIAITLAALAYGLIEDRTIERGAFLRHSLGLVHPNSFGMFSMLLILYYIQFKQTDLRLIHYAGLAVQSIIVFLITNSRASFALSLLLIVLSFLFSRTENRLFLKNALTIILIAILILAPLWFVLCLCYGTDLPVMVFLNKLFSNRINFSNKALLKYPPTLFGNNVTFDIVVDTLFTYTLIIYGYAGLCIFMAMFYSGALHAYRKSLPFVLIALLAFQLYNTQENVFLYHLFDLTMFTVICDLD